MRLLVLLCLTVLTACAAAPPPTSFRDVDRTTPQQKIPRPVIEGYGSALAMQPIRWSATTLADDFVELMYFTEWGAEIGGLLRWEEPVRVALLGQELNRYRSDVTDLINRLSSAAPGLDIALADQTGGEALASRNIVLRTAPRAEMKDLAPTALCFFVPFDGDWRAYLAARTETVAQWSTLEKLDTVTIFIPAYSAPMDIRACIREEITQALGPGNDLTRLEDSMFNDDNAYTRPTSFDLLMLRVLYDPALKAGMEQDEARRAALTALARPDTPQIGGARRFRRVADDRYQVLSDKATEADAPTEGIKWGRQAMELAETFGPEDHRVASSLVQISVEEYRRDKTETAIDLLRQAEQMLLNRLGPDNTRLAKVRIDLATLLIKADEAEQALTALNAALPVLAAYGDDLQIAVALRWQAAALLKLGRETDARRVAKQAIEWSKYVFGATSDLARAWSDDFADIGL